MVDSTFDCLLVHAIVKRPEVSYALLDFDSIMFCELFMLAFQ